MSCGVSIFIAGLQINQGIVFFWKIERFANEASSGGNA
jgi:hypothetical protein